MFVMSRVIIVNSNNAAFRESTEAAAQRVFVQFGDSLPDARLLCFFDETDSLHFKNGRATRGLYWPVDEDLWKAAPDYVKEHLAVRHNSGLLTNAFDHFIYLHGSTCRNEIGLTITFAHELQHFTQRMLVPDLHAAGLLIVNLSRETI